MARQVSRRDFLASGLVALGAAVAGPAVWRAALAAPTVGDGPYGPLLAPDANGLMLPDGFTSREIARSGVRIRGTSYVWHGAPDGGACFEAPDGWVYVSNSEISGTGGVGAVRFDDDGSIVDAYRIASGTSRNCAGGPTPWGTWLTCEEHERGRVWECDPLGQNEARPLPALGVFTHEAAAVDPDGRAVYLTEDEPDGRFYRFIPDAYPSLDVGTLQVAVVSGGGAVSWSGVPDPAASSAPTRGQVAASTRFDGGEGAWFDAGVVYFTTKGDDRVWSYDTRAERMTLLYDASAIDGAPLRGVDNITVSDRSGDLFVAEDGGDLEIVMITPDDEVARLLRLTGDAHSGSEIAGPALDPSGRRLYFSSQRGFGDGVTYEVRGPFRATRLDRPQATGSPRPLPLRRDDPTPFWLYGGAGAAAAAVLAVIGRRLRAGGGRSTG